MTTIIPQVQVSDVTGSAAVQATDKHVDTVSGPEKTTAEDTKLETQEALSPRFAALARQQKAFREQQKAFQAQKQLFETERQARQEEIEQAKSWKTKLTQDPLSAITEAGITYEQLTNAILNQPSSQDLQYQKLFQEVQSLRQSQEQSSTRFEDLQKQQYEDAKKQIRNDVSMLVDGNEVFETIKAMNAQEAVVELIEETYKEENRLMTIDEAAQAVEDYLVEEAMKLASLKKIQAKFSPPPSPEVQQTQPTQKTQMQTLSNRMVQSTTKSLNAKEKRERAILAFQGKLS